MLRQAERAWHNECEDVAKLNEIQETTKTLSSLRPSTNGDPVYLASELVTYGDAPGYRKVHFVFDVTPIGQGIPQEKHRIELTIRPQDAEAIVSHILEVHSFAWGRDSGAPLDASPGERRPRWVDR